VVNQTLLAGNVATRGTERLGECSHQDVDRSGVDTEVLGDTASVRSQSTDGVSLIDEEVELDWSATYQTDQKMNDVPCTSP
jgi:hypothetical protein